MDMQEQLERLKQELPAIMGSIERTEATFESKNYPEEVIAVFNIWKTMSRTALHYLRAALDTESGELMRGPFFRLYLAYWRESTLLGDTLIFLMRGF